MANLLSIACDHPRLWTAENARRHLLHRVTESALAARQAGLRPRLVLFDYTDHPVAGPLRAMASELEMLVTLEPIERSLPSSQLRDRFRLLEKSRGVHGVFLPPSLTPAHQSCLEAHPAVAALALDQAGEGFSPQMVSFLQLAALNGWNPQGRKATVLLSEETRTMAASLVKELQSLDMTVTAVPHQAALSGSLSRSALVWLCHGRPLTPASLHLAPDAVVVDSGRAHDLGASFSLAQSRLLSHRLRGICPAEGGLASLVNLNRLQRLLQRALGPRRSRTASPSAARGRVRA
jgi:hypothetical protein